HPVEEQAIRIGRLDFEILRHHRREPSVSRRRRWSVKRHRATLTKGPKRRISKARAVHGYGSLLPPAGEGGPKGRMRVTRRTRKPAALPLTPTLSRKRERGLGTRPLFGLPALVARSTLAHGHQFLRRGRMQRQGRVEIGLLGAHLHRDAEKLR